jgi:hypothetical protein
MFDQVRAKLATPYTPVAPTLTDPTHRVAAAIIAAGELARSDPPPPDKKNSAALFMVQRSLARIEAQKQFRKLGFVRP